MNTDKLRELAQAATDPELEYDPYDNGETYNAYIAAANPTAILELLDALKEIGELRRYDMQGDICGATIQIDDKGQYVSYYELKAILDKL